MFTRNYYTGELSIVNLPVHHRDAVTMYVASRAQPFIRVNSFVSCDACGRTCNWVSGEIYLCVQCTNDCRWRMTQALQPVVITPTIKPMRVLVDGAKYALAMLLAVYDTTKHASTIQCDCCIHSRGYHCVLSRGDKLMLALSVCGGCLSEAQSCAAIIRKMIPLVHYVLSPLDDSGTIIRDWIWLSGLQ